MSRRHHHEPAVGKLKRVVMDMRIVHIDLAEASDALGQAGPAEQSESTVVLHVPIEGDFGAGKEADGHLWFAERGETARDRLNKVGGNKPVRYLGRTRGDEVQAVIAHVKALLMRPPDRLFAIGCC